MIHLHAGARFAVPLSISRRVLAIAEPGLESVDTALVILGPMLAFHRAVLAIVSRALAIVNAVPVIVANDEHLL